MKRLAAEFKIGKWRFVQLRREGMAAIYVRTKIAERRRLIESYEVIKIRKHNGYTIAGITIEAAETYPSSCDCGKYGWTYRTFEDAIAKFKCLLQQTRTHETAIFIAREGEDSGIETKTLLERIL